MSPAPQIHDTFLDAFEPSSDESRYGKKADWADNYVDTRSVDYHLGLDGTKLFLENAYNVNVTPAGSNDCGPVCRHSRPYRFYGESIHDSFIGNALDAENDPLSGRGDTGYPLSVESKRLLASLNIAYPKGAKCVASDDPCTYEVPPPHGSWFAPVLPARSVKGTAGMVTYAIGPAAFFDSIKLGSVPLSILVPAVEAVAATAPTEAPSWIVIDATTAEPVNKLRFKWRFGSAGDGLLRVFVDGMLVREIDQRYVSGTATEAEVVYIGGAVGTLAPGMHRIVFRLDGFAVGASGVELTGVELGLVTPGTRRRAARH